MSPEPAWGITRAMRGGNWGFGEGRARVYFRDFDFPDYCSGFLGLRLVRRMS